MTVIATASNPRFWVSRVDIDRDGSDVHHRHAARPRARSCPDADLYFITGADALSEIFTWRDADELFDLAHFVGCTRPGFTHGPLDARAACPSDKVTILEIPALAISSTDCRERRDAGRAGLVPRARRGRAVHHQVRPLRPRPTHLEARTHAMTATDRALELVRTAAQAASDKLAENIVAFDVSEQLVITDAFLLARRPTTARSRRSSTRSRTSCARSAPSRYAARASATAAGCSSTTPRSSCTCSTRRSGRSTPSSGSGATAR